MSRDATPTPLEVLLAHGLPQQHLESLARKFDGVEALAAWLSRHEAEICADGCPWHPGGDLDTALAATTRAVNGWCSVGWFERGLEPPPEFR